MLLPCNVIVPTTISFSAAIMLHSFAKITLSNCKLASTPFSIKLIAESLPLKSPDTGVDPIKVKVTSSCHNSLRESKSLFSKEL